MATLTDAQLAELRAIAARDAKSNDWLTGPPASFSAQAARDRRALLALVRTLLLDLENYPPQPEGDVT